jgi:hypothetical protein
MRVRSTTRAITLIVALLLLMIALFGLQITLAQQTPTPGMPTPTSPFDLNAVPTVGVIQTATAPPSLSGVNGVAERGGPAITYTRIGGFRQGSLIDIVGYNGYNLSRPCSANFAADLDMWVAVQYRGTVGWVARCALTITGEFNLSRMLLNAPPDGAPTPRP